MLSPDPARALVALYSAPLQSKDLTLTTADVANRLVSQAATIRTFRAQRSRDAYAAYLQIPVAYIHGCEAGTVVLTPSQVAYIAVKAGIRTSEDGDVREASVSTMTLAELVGPLLFAESPTLHTIGDALSTQIAAAIAELDDIYPLS